MAIYIEYALLDNLTFNYLLLLAVSKTLRLQAGFWRLALCAAIGCAVSLVLALSTLSGVVLSCIKVALCCLLGFLLSVGKNVRKAVYSILLFAAYTFLLGGIMLALFYGARGYSYEQTALFYSTNVPLGLYVLAILVCWYVVCNVTDYIKNARKNTKFGYKVTILLNQKVFEAEAFLDSGNGCEQDGLPVCFVTDRHLQTKLLTEATECAYRGQNVLTKAEFSTLSSQSSVLAVRAKLVLCGHSQDIILAFVDSRKEDYSILLNNKVEGLV